MQVITQTRLREFGRKHADADGPLRVWEANMRSKKYRTPHEVKADYGGNVDFIGKNKAVFDIGGNKYRLVVKMLFKRGWVLIRHVVTHKEYDKLNADGTL